MFLHWAFLFKIYSLYSCTFQRIIKNKFGNVNNLIVYLQYNKQLKTKIMTNETLELAKQNAKQIMDLLMECILDKNISIEDRKKYYADYIKISTNYLILSK